MILVYQMPDVISINKQGHRHDNSTSSSSDDSDINNDLDSDDDGSSRPSKKSRPTIVAVGNKRNNKYSIWGSVIQEQTLTSELSGGWSRSV